MSGVSRYNEVRKQMEVLEMFRHPFFKDGASWRRTVLAGIVCSVIIEIAQPVFGIAFDINDIILNTVGVLISATVFSFVKGIIEKRKKA